MGMAGWQWLEEKNYIYIFYLPSIICYVLGFFDIGSTIRRPQEVSCTQDFLKYVIFFLHIPFWKTGLLLIT